LTKSASYKAGHMTAPRNDQNHPQITLATKGPSTHDTAIRTTRKLPLQRRGRPHMTPPAFLAPDIVHAIVDGRQSPTLTADSLIKSRHRILWADQRAWILAL
jgi:hypothetical protein